MLIPVILCGGSGNRLWPLSREHYPKQLLALTGKHSLLQQTALRAQQITPDTAPLIIANQRYRFHIVDQLQEVGITAKDFILEPCPRNTAPALALAALQALTYDAEPYLLIMPSDHLLPSTTTFNKVIQLASQYATTNKLITFGIEPSYPETGYGYIHAGENICDGIISVKAFVEKPSLEIAESYLKAGNYYWNSGIFIFPAKLYLQELQRYAKNIYDTAKLAFNQRQRDLDFLVIPEKQFAKCPNDSIDYAVLEHSEHVVCAPLNTPWTDIGSWDALWQASDSDNNGNVTRGDIISEDNQNCYLRAENRLLAAVGLKDTVVVETADAVLIADKNRCQDIKKIVTQLKQNDRVEATSHRKLFRPWGYYETLSSGPGFLVNRITIYPGGKMALQTHQQRAEHWIIVAGTASITRDHETFSVHANQSTYIPANSKHRLANNGSELLILIEVQSGNQFGLNDITRHQDTDVTQPLEALTYE